MGLGLFIKRIFTWWDGQTLGTQLMTWRTGQRVGEDDFGNVFYRNRDDTRRWVIYNGESEASRVGPEWHGWLHHTFKEPPTERPFQRKEWEKPWVPNPTGTPEAYAPSGSIRRREAKPATDYEAWSPE